MVTSLYRFSEVQAKTAKPSTVYHIIEELLRANDDAAYQDMERYLRGAANTGSAQFDHAHAVRVLMEHDSTAGGLLHVVMRETNLSEKEIWDRLQSVLRNAGFRMSNGKLTGLMIEDQSSDNNETANAA